MFCIFPLMSGSNLRQAHNDYRLLALVIDIACHFYRKQLKETMQLHPQAMYYKSVTV